MMRLFPWLEADWRRIAGEVDDRHHGAVLGGINGIGKREFSLALAQKYLCSNPAEYACDDCQSCRLFNAGSHPDFHVLVSEQEIEFGRLELLSAYAARYPEERPGRERKSSVIKVEKVRQLIDRFYQSSYIGTGRVALLLPADRMNLNAANALLKLLEEPPPQSLFLLVTDQPGALLPTIRSRCIVETLSTPSEAVVGDWLEGRTEVESTLLRGAIESGEGPLQILAAAESGELAQRDANLRVIGALLAGTEDPVALSEGLSKQDPNQLLYWMQGLVCQMARWQVAGSPSPWSDSRAVSARPLSAEALFGVYDKISAYRRLARDQLNLRLAVEEILISLRELA